MPQSRHPKRKPKNKPDSLLLNPNRELEKIDGLIEAGKTDEAWDELESLAARAPYRADIYETMFALAVQTKDHHKMFEPAIRLAELKPYVPVNCFNVF